MSENCKDIISEYLKKHGHDGLCWEECGCGIDDLMPCDAYCGNCVPAYKRPATAEEAEELNCDEGDAIFVQAPDVATEENQKDG